MKKMTSESKVIEAEDNATSNSEGGQPGKKVIGNAMRLVVGNDMGVIEISK